MIDDKSPYKYLIFICTNERSPNNPRGCCLHLRGDEVLKKFKEEISVRNLKQKGVRATKSGCLDFCEEGPNVVIYGPNVTNSDGVWYRKVTPEDVTEIIESHILQGTPVERIRNKFRMND
ncbi:MAG: (2Fe-2S) ferredoxin domain-containing protein [Candidatus Hodarchaeales archaeon]|jgi:(2Fe-2S) ferredoxin